jgi:hypothetical protein
VVIDGYGPDDVRSHGAPQIVERKGEAVVSNPEDRTFDFMDFRCSNIGSPVYESAG